MDKKVGSWMRGKEGLFVIVQGVWNDLCSVELSWWLWYKPLWQTNVQWLPSLQITHYSFKVLIEFINKYIDILIVEYEMRFFHPFLHTSHHNFTSQGRSASNRHGFFGTILGQDKKSTIVQESGKKSRNERSRARRVKPFFPSPPCILQHYCLPIHIC